MSVTDRSLKFTCIIYVNILNCKEVINFKMSKFLLSSEIHNIVSQ